jgi:hypothetical protein
MRQADVLTLLQAAGLAAELRKLSGLPPELAKLGEVGVYTNDILNRLMDAVHPELKGAANQILPALYVDTVDNRPQDMIGLFPLCAKFCGDRGKGMYTDIDWSLIQ